jgi:hypothetical protein
MQLQTRQNTFLARKASFTPLGATRVHRKCACGGTPGPTGECEACHKKRLSLQRSMHYPGIRTGSEFPVAPIVREVLSSSSRPLDPATAAFMEQRFGQDFSQVRVHTDTRAAESAQAVHGHAYTVGSHIVFGQGKFEPESSAGRRLLAHELCHVVQQSRAAGMAPARVVQRDDAQDTPAPSQSGQSPLAKQLFDLADEVEHAQSEGGDSATFGQTAAFAERLRMVARNNDATEQIRVLEAFTPSHLAKIQQQAAQGGNAAQQASAIQRSADGLDISDPRDRAEIEADRVANEVVSGGRVTVDVTPAPILHRQGAEAALSGLLAFEAAGGAEAEIAGGPPGWVIGGLALLAIGGLTIVTMARPRVGTCSCQHRDIFTSGGRSCLELRTSGVCGGPYTGVGSDSASCQANARASAPAPCQGCLGHCLFRPG